MDTNLLYCGYTVRAIHGCESAKVSQGYLQLLKSTEFCFLKIKRAIKHLKINCFFVHFSKYVVLAQWCSQITI